MRTSSPRNRWKRAKMSAGTYVLASCPRWNGPLAYGHATPMNTRATDGPSGPKRWKAHLNVCRRPRAVANGRAVTPPHGDDNGKEQSLRPSSNGRRAGATGRDFRHPPDVRGRPPEFHQPRTRRAGFRTVPGGHRGALPCGGERGKPLRSDRGDHPTAGARGRAVCGPRPPHDARECDHHGEWLRRSHVDRARALRRGRRGPRPEPGVRAVRTPRPPGGGGAGPLLAHRGPEVPARTSRSSSPWSRGGRGPSWSTVPRTPPAECSRRGRSTSSSSSRTPTTSSSSRTRSTTRSSTRASSPPSGDGRTGRSSSTRSRRPSR